MNKETWYRYEDKRYAGSCDEWGDPIPGSGRTEIELRKYEVYRRTPKGVWLTLWGGSRRFVLLSATRRFACPTLDEAAESFLARKAKQASIYRARLNEAERTIARFKTMEGRRKNIAPRESIFA